MGDGHSVSILYDLYIGDLLLSRWPTFISSEVIDSMRIIDLLLADGRRWNWIAVSCLSGVQLGEWVSSLAIFIYSKLDIRN